MDRFLWIRGELLVGADFNVCCVSASDFDQECEMLNTFEEIAATKMSKRRLIAEAFGD